MKQIQIHEAIGKNYSPSLAIVFNKPTFVRLVEMACWAIQRVVISRSPEYVRPAAYSTPEVLQNHRDALLEMSPEFFQSQRDIADGSLSSTLNEGLELVLSYVEWVNNRRDAHEVGETQVTYQLVYLTLLHYNNWTVKRIDALHEMRGKHFGSACRDQLESAFDGVRDWPTKFGFSDLRRQELLLPAKREETKK